MTRLQAPPNGRIRAPRGIDRRDPSDAQRNEWAMGLTATKVKAAKRGLAKSRGGRPTRDAAIERDQRLIEAATRLFLERGFDATSIDALAEAARVSKPTVYAQYGDKRGLFAAVLRREIARWLAPLAEAASEMRFDDLSAGAVEQRLIDLGRQLLSMNCGDDAIAFSRILTAQAINFPEIAKLAVDEGWSKAVSTTAVFFDHLVAGGALDPRGHHDRGRNVFSTWWSATPIGWRRSVSRSTWKPPRSGWRSRSGCSWPAPLGRPTGSGTRPRAAAGRPADGSTNLQIPQRMTIIRP